MFGLNFGAQGADKADILAIGRSLAMIAFDPKGNVLSANENFCKTLGYRQDEIVGRHHSLFCDEAYAKSPEYRAFWERLGRGEFDAGEYRRRAKSGSHVYIRASYNPVLDAKGRVLRVVKVAADVTLEKLQAAEFKAKMDAVSSVQAVIEFTPAGEILTANPNFFAAMGYTIDEIRGRHHRMFVDPIDATSAEYEAFWRRLNAGESVVNSFRRIAKGGREVWLQASYNPVFNLEGKVMKVIKFANDITDLTRLAEGLARVAGNDVERGIETPFSPTFEKLRLDFNKTADNLRGALGRIAESASIVKTGAAEIESASLDLSRRAEQQAASLEEAAAALEEVTGTVRSTAAGVQEARTVVSEARGDAETSGEIVHKAVEAMGRIEKSSSEIAKIIGLIDEIAFQTNLLALNAGVEAARAGDAGRGFAVVASEVRALAQRTVDAAKQIKTLISASSGEVGTGVRLVSDAGGALKRIAKRVDKLNEVVQRIAAGAQEQATALEEVSTAVNEMDQVTQHNAATAEETNAACSALFKEIDRLNEEVFKFKLGGRAASAEAGRGPAVRSRAA
jgi:methyl-accepting chemotaxis protein